MPATEGAKAALFDADIGKIDVAVDYVGDHVADSLCAQVICRSYHRQKIGTVSFEELRRRVDRYFVTGEGLVENLRCRRRYDIEQMFERSFQVWPIHGGTLAFRPAKLNDGVISRSLLGHPIAREL